MKRILMVSCEGLGNGGVQAVMMSIVKNLSDTYRFDMLLFTNEKRYYDDAFLSYGGQIHRIPRYAGKNPVRKKMDYYIRGRHVYRHVLKLLQEHGPYDAIHCNNELESAPVLMAAAKAGIPVRIVHTHVISKRRPFLIEWFHDYRRNRIEQHATVKLACSKDAGVSFYKNTKNVFVINNAFDNNRFDPTKYPDTDRREFRILQIGRYDAIKNQLFSIAVMERIKANCPEAKMILVGSGQGHYMAAMQQEISSRHLEDGITLLPADADTPALLSQASSFILPSLHEGFGIVLVEAQAMGVRCYASDTVPEAANGGGVAYLPLTDGAEKWAERIVDDYRSAQGVCGRFDVSEYTIESVMEKYRRIYEGEME